MGARAGSQWVLSAECQLLRRPAGEGPCAIGLGRDGRAAGGGCGGPTRWASGRPTNNASIISQRPWRSNGLGGGRFRRETQPRGPGAAHWWGRWAVGLGRAGAEGAVAGGTWCPSLGSIPLPSLSLEALSVLTRSAVQQASRTRTRTRVQARIQPPNRTAAGSSRQLQALGAWPDPRPPVWLGPPAVSQISCPSLPPCAVPFPPRHPSPASAALAGSPLRALLLRLEAGSARVLP